MNGWQRIGIVAFLIWAVAAFGWFWIDKNQPGDETYALEARFCRGEDFEKEQRCQELALERWRARAESNERAFWRYIPFIIAIPALLVWGLISLVIVTVRWIRKGFA